MRVQIKKTLHYEKLRLRLRIFEFLLLSSKKDLLPKCQEIIRCVSSLVVTVA